MSKLSQIERYFDSALRRWWLFSGTANATPLFAELPIQAWCWICRTVRFPDTTLAGSMLELRKDLEVELSLFNNLMAATICFIASIKRRSWSPHID